MKIGFTTDTNFFGVKNQKNDNGKKFLSDMDYFIDYIQDLKTTTTKHELIYYVTDLVMEELYHQKLSIFEASYNAFVKKYNLLQYGLEGQLPKSKVEKVLTEEKEKYKEKVRLLKIDYSKKLFKEIIKDSLIKKPPFDKNKPNTGFKDSLIWKTILYTEDIDKCDEFYLFSGDKIFRDNEEDLLKEFRKEHPNVKFYIKFKEPNGKQRQEALKDLIDIYSLYETEVVKLYNNNFILKFLQELNYIEHNEVSYYCGDSREVILKDIIFRQFDCNDFYVNEVKKEQDEYIINCSFRTMKYVTDIEISEESKKYLTGDVEIKLKESNKEYSFINSEIRNIDFDLEVIDLLRGLTIKGTTSIVSQIGEIIKKNLICDLEVENSLKYLKDAIEPYKKQKDEMLNSIHNPLKDYVIPNISDLIKGEQNE